VGLATVACSCGSAFRTWRDGFRARAPSWGRPLRHSLEPYSLEDAASRCPWCQRRYERHRCRTGQSDGPLCVDNYSVTRSLLDIGDVTPHLSGRTLIQLSTGTPREARESEGWASKHGAGYLDSAILGLPSKIGAKELVILVSRKEVALVASRPTLKCLAGDLRYVGETVGAAAALDLAFLPNVLVSLWV
jgi:hypothetical protein